MTGYKLPCTYFLPLLHILSFFLTFISVEVDFKSLSLRVLPTVTQFTKCNYIFPPHLATSATKSPSRCGGISVNAAAGGLGTALTNAAMFFCVRLLTSEESVEV